MKITNASEGVFIKNLTLKETGASIDTVAQGETVEVNFNAKVAKDIATSKDNGVSVEVTEEEHDALVGTLEYIVLPLSKNYSVEGAEEGGSEG